jgi:ubiquinone/menaquinone biosynthesis C-methylase UbiE
MSDVPLVHDSKSKEVQKFLAEPDIHQQWEKAYRTADNDHFVDQVYDYLTRVLDAPNNSIFLDAGCGSCAHAVRLASHGFFVQAIDFSESILQTAKINIKARKFENKITLQNASILSLPFKDKSFGYVLCWGVLMHIPDLEQALSELVRVLKPGGTLIISENNRYSFQSLIRLGLKRLLKLGQARIKITPAGTEYWYDSPKGMFLTRQTDIGWLINRLKNKRFVVKARVAGQFTDLYAAVSFRFVKKLIHNFNNLWFRYIKIAYPAGGNILIVQKDS